MEVTGTLRSSTLHAAASDPAKLAFITLFRGAHPRWTTDNVIFTKSRLGLLPGCSEYEEHATPTAPANHESNHGGSNVADSEYIRTSSSAAGCQELDKNDWVQDVDAFTPVEEAPAPLTDPIAVFNETASGFKFVGWYRVIRITILEPQTAELKHMLDQKWAPPDPSWKLRPERRDSKAWHRSFNRYWAEVKLIKDKVADKKRGHPLIARSETQPGESANQKQIWQERQRATCRVEDERCLIYIVW